MGKEIKHCPCCGQVMMVYRRNIRKCMLYCLRTLFFKYKYEWKKVIEIDERVNIGSNFPLLRHWGLIESEEQRYRITKKGVCFILGKIAIPKYVWLYNEEIQNEPDGEVNPLIFCWDIAPQEISKETVLEDARAYPIVDQEQIEMFI